MTLLSSDHPGRLLARYALQGLITLEALDQPTTIWQAMEADRRAVNARAQRLGRGPAFPPPPEWRNLAREWIAAHPKEWEEMLRNTLAQEDATAQEDLAP